MFGCERTSLDNCELFDDFEPNDDVVGDDDADDDGDDGDDDGDDDDDIGLVDDGDSVVCDEADVDAIK